MKKIKFLDLKKINLKLKKSFFSDFKRVVSSGWYISAKEVENFEKAILPDTKLIYLESPNSWSYELQDLAAVADFAAGLR